MNERLNITYVGHATLIIEMNGVRFLTDPVFRKTIYHLRRKGPSIDPGWYKNIDAVFISHAHGDHLDIPSLRRIPTTTPLYTPRGLIEILSRQGFSKIHELTIGDRISLGNLLVETTYAKHKGARPGLSHAKESLGFLFSGSHNVYFPGDTDLFPEMAKIAKRLDLALLPVWGWGPTLGNGHMDPYRAAQALQYLKPRLAIPIHWGTYYPWFTNYLKPFFLFQPPRQFIRFAARLAPGVNVKILEPGESFCLDVG